MRIKVHNSLLQGQGGISFVHSDSFCRILLHPVSGILSIELGRFCAERKLRYCVQNYYFGDGEFCDFYLGK